MDRSTFSGKDREFGVVVLAGIERVFQKMLPNSRVMGNNLRSVVFFTGTGKIRAILERMMVSDRPGNMLLNAFLQPLKCTFYIPTIPVAHNLINNIYCGDGQVIHPSWLREEEETTGVLTAK